MQNYKKSANNKRATTYMGVALCVAVSEGQNRMFMPKLKLALLFSG